MNTSFKEITNGLVSREVVAGQVEMLNVKHAPPEGAVMQNAARRALATGISGFVSRFDTHGVPDPRGRDLLPQNISAMELKRMTGVSAEDIRGVSLYSRGSYIFVDSEQRGWKLAESRSGKGRAKRAARIAGRSSQKYGKSFSNSFKETLRTDASLRTMYRIQSVDVPINYQPFDPIRDPQAEGKKAKERAMNATKARESREKALSAEASVW